jgi:serine/threonine protein kinase
MADIYVARQQGMAGFDKIVALKFLRDIGDASSGVREMFLDEVRTAALLNHPNIVATFDADELGDRLFLAMEFVHGETLGRFARSVVSSSGRFPIELAVAIARDLANALDYAHALTHHDGTPLELVHRDVSPSNILLSFDGMVKLLDFGIAKVATQLTATGAGVIKGKFSYMAPEQARGHDVDRRADIYSLGIVLWQLITGKAAFEARSDGELLRMVANPLLAAPSVTRTECSEALDEIVMTALAPRVSDRYETAGEFATALSRYLTRHAAGFDATKLIRGLMTVHFRDRRDKLAALVKRSDPDYALDDLEVLVQQPSLRTPTPKVPSPQQTGSETAIEASSPVSAIKPLPPPPRARRWPWVVLLLAGCLGGGYALQLGDDEPARVAIAAAVDAPATRAELAEPRTHEAPAARAIEPAPVEPSPVVPPRSVRVIAPPRPVVRTPPKAVAKVAVTKAERAGSAEARGSNAGSGSGSARIAQEPPPEIPIPERGSGTPPRVPPPPVAPPREVGSLDATASVTRVSVNGSLTTSEVQSALERTTGQLRACYRAAAGRAQHTPLVTLKVSFVIDEARAPRGVQVAGDPIGLAACAREAIANIRTRSAPDVGTVAVTAQISFKPRKATP